MVRTMVWDGSGYLGESKKMMSATYMTFLGRVVHEGCRRPRGFGARTNSSTRATRSGPPVDGIVVSQLLAQEDNS